MVLAYQHSNIIGSCSLSREALDKVRRVRYRSIPHEPKDSSLTMMRKTPFAPANDKQKSPKGCGQVQIDGID